MNPVYSLPAAKEDITVCASEETLARNGMRNCLYTTSINCAKKHFKKIAYWNVKSQIQNQETGQHQNQHKTIELVGRESFQRIFLANNSKQKIQ